MSKNPVAILYDSDGANPVGTATHPLRTDPTGSTAQPVSATALPLPSGAATSAAQTDGTQKTQVTSLPALPSGTNTIGKVDQGAAGATAWKVDGSAVTQPVSGPLTDAQLRATAVPVSGPLTDAQLRATAVPVSAASLPLPTGAATESTLSAMSTKLPALGQALMAASQPVVIASNQSAVPVSGPLTDAQLRASAVPVSGPLTDTQLRATAVPVSAAALPLPSGAATSAAQGIGNSSLSSIDGKTPSLGQAAMAVSVPVVIANNQTAVPVSATALPLPTGAATETTQALQATAVNQTNGTQKAIVRSGAKGASVAADVTSSAVDADTQALHVKLVGGGGGGGIPQDVNVQQWFGSTAPTVGQKAMAASLPVALASNQSPVPVTISPGGSAPGFSFGDIALASITTALVTRTAYTEQTTNAQRSLVSANANDSSAGTGARQVKITYLDQTGAGPYTETVTLNGTTAVNTVATNICFIERLEVVSVGSGGVNAGIITLKAATAGGGATIITIAAGDNQTLCAIHYVPTGKTGYISGLACCSNSSVAGNGSVFYVRSKAIGAATAPKVQVTDFVTIYGQTSNVSRAYGTPIRVVGPASIEAWVRTFVNNALTYRASVDYYDL